MRAVIYDRYGPPDVLRLEEVPDPTPADGEVLIEVKATSVNLSDWETLVGSPLYARIGGLRRPRARILGSDLAGLVVAVGPSVTTFAVGDEVYGDNLFPKGGFAELAVVPVEALAAKPPELSFAQAAAIPQSGVIALQGMAGAGPGTTVLINGAGGGSGALAIQVAKRAGAIVTAVDDASKLDFMQSLGADEAIDYRTTDFTRTGDRWDLILDLVAKRSVLACIRALRPGGRYRAVGGTVPALLQLVTLGSVIGPVTGRRIGVLPVREGPEHFASMADAVVAGEIVVPIARRFPLDEVPEALTMVGAGRSLGKVVVEIS